MPQTRAKKARSFPIVDVRFGHLLIGAALLIMLAARSQANPSALCQTAMTRAAFETGVPTGVLAKLPLTQATQELRPWPWSIHINGRSLWFDTAAQAHRHVFEAFRAGARQFDIGCFQVNYAAYSQDFASLEDIFDPLINARHAARALKSLHADLGDWDKAVGVYQSRTAQFTSTWQKGPRQSPEQRLLAERVAPVRTGPSLFPRQSSSHTNAGIAPFGPGGARSLFTSEDGA